MVLTIFNIISYNMNVYVKFIGELVVQPLYDLRYNFRVLFLLAPDFMYLPIDGELLAYAL